MTKKKATHFRKIYPISDKPGWHLPELEMVGYAQFSEASPLNNHLHERSFEFVYVESGKVIWEVGGGLYETHAGQVFHSKPDEWHRPLSKHIQPCKIWWIILRDPLTTDHWLNLRDEERIQMGEALSQLPRTITIGSALSDPFRHIQNAIEYHEPLSTLKIRHYALDVLLRILYPTSELRIPDDLHDALERLMSDFGRSPEKRMSNADMAAELGVSESHFFRIFRNKYGQSPAAYMERLRIEHACRILTETERPITSIAMDLGFKTSQHFATIFKKNTGYSPRQWRQENGQENST